jgi:beta-mannosidase
MHLRYRFNVKKMLHPGENTLEIMFRSAVVYAEEQRARLGDMFRPSPYELPYNIIRKNACNFGWDWGPILDTAGIWRAIHLEGWPRLMRPIRGDRKSVV